MDRQKHIWIVNYYTTPPEFVSNERHLKFSHYLQKAGYRVTIFSSGFLRENRRRLVDRSSDFKIVDYGEHHFCHINVCGYKGNGLARMFSIFQFSWKILLNRKKFEKPDIILHNMHAPFDYLICTCAKKLNVRYIAEEWDLWPEYFVTFGLISARNPLMKWAYSRERKMFESASDIIFSFAGGIAYLREKGWTMDSGGKINPEKVYYINNGVSIFEFNQNKEKFSLNDIDVENDNIFKIIYLGSISLANDIKQLIDAVALLKEYKDIRLLIYGNGEQRDPLIKYCSDRQISNVIFKEKRIPLTFVPYVLSHSNLNIMNYRKGFGDHGVSAGKLFQSLAAGRPIICNCDIRYDDVITDNNIGRCGGLDTPKKYSDAILEIYNLSPEKYAEMCKRVLEVCKRFDYSVLSENLIDMINS